MVFHFLCCKAAEVSDKATELVTAGQEKLQAGQEKLKAAADEFTLGELKAAFVGQSTKVSEAPDVLVTVEDVALKEGGAGLSSMSSFSLKGLLCKVKLQVQGTPAQMAGMVAADYTGKLFELLAQGEKAVTGALGVAEVGVAERVSSKAAGAKASLAESAAAGQEHKALSFDVVLDLVKVAGVEEVMAKVVAVTSSHEAVNKVMSIGSVKKYVEVAVSRQVSQVMTEWQKKTFTLAEAKERGAGLVAQGVAGAKEQGADLLAQGMAGARERGGDLVAKGMAKGEALVGVAKSKAER